MMKTVPQIAFAESILDDDAPIDPHVVALLGDMDAFPPLMPSSAPTLGGDGWQMIYSFEAENRRMPTHTSSDSSNDNDRDDCDSVMTWEYLDEDGGTQSHIQTPAQTKNMAADAKIVKQGGKQPPAAVQEPEADNDDECDAALDSFDAEDMRAQYKSSRARYLRTNPAARRRRKHMENIVGRNVLYRDTPIIDGSEDDETDSKPSSSRKEPRVAYSYLRKQVTCMRKWERFDRKEMKTCVDLSVDVYPIEKTYIRARSS